MAKVRITKSGTVAVHRLKPAELFDMGSEVEILCLGDRLVKVGKRHGSCPPEVVYIRAARVTDRYNKGAHIRAVDADGVVYEIKVVQKSTPRVKVTSERWRICHFVADPEQGRLIIDATAQRLKRWHARMDKIDTLSAQLGHLKAASDRDLGDEQAELLALRTNNGTADLSAVFSRVLADFVPEEPAT